MKRNYHTIDKQGKAGGRKLTEFLVCHGQALLPMMELIEHSRMAIDELIDVMGRASIEAVLELSAMQVAGPPQPGKARPSEVGWHGTQPGRVYLKERKLKVNRPRLRNKGRGANKEVSVPAPSDAAEQRHRRAHAGNPDERRVHARLQQSHS